MKQTKIELFKALNISDINELKGLGIKSRSDQCPIQYN